MRNIEKLISPLVKSQFPAFYQEEGPQFIAFVKAYYEWMEQPGNPLYQARSLNDYRDIDTTLDEFIIYFKEKYLKNIQFDIATNKQLLVKNSLNLYRSKGTERSIDLFFKLVYGTNAEVQYPAENILKVSDGLWELPIYLEVSSSAYNINYVGKQIIGALSGATAFVERYIRRRTERGYVNILYISNQNGAFKNGEVLGINVNNTPVFNNLQNAKLIGSVNRVEIENKGILFNIGDIVSFGGSERGYGGLARVAAVSNATGVIDFLFLDGGYGYTLNASSIVSEKVINFANVIADTASPNYFRLFEELVEPIVNVNFTSAQYVSNSAIANINVGDGIYRYSSTNQLIGQGKVLLVKQTSGSATGTIVISHVNGTFTNTTTFYTDANVVSLYANTVEDKTISGQIMGIPTAYDLYISNQSDNISVGQYVYQKDTNSYFAHGTISSITPISTGNVVTVIDARGAFKNSKRHEDAEYTVGTGTITSATNSVVVTGSGTLFNSDYLGAVIYSTANASLGTVAFVTNATSLSLKSTASIAVSGAAHNYGLKYPIYIGDSNVTANVESINLTTGVYNIRKYINQINYISANNNTILDSAYVYQYYPNNSISAKGLVVTSTYTSGSGALTYVPVKGYFADTKVIYTEANTANATVSSHSTTISGGDYIASSNSRMFTQTTNTVAVPVSLSYGSGAGFNVGTIGDKEVIFIGTDLIGANGVATLDYDRRILNVASSTGFAIGNYVYQTVNQIAFNPNTSIAAATGFITLPTANSKFLAGDIVQYTVAAGNTAIVGLTANDFYHVAFSNTSGLILSYPYRKKDNINTTNFSGFKTGALSQTGHYLHKLVYGTVSATGSGTINILDRLNYFAATGGTVSTTVYANSNVILYSAPSTNTSITSVAEYTTIVQANQAYIPTTLRAPAFGFPKNPQGDIKDIIYSCLNFGRFEIGTIGNLSGINPGTEYNQDPYVLAYQPYISAFDRNDFLITITSATSNFVIGEKINQTLPNLSYYDLKVASDVYSNVYSAVNKTINSQSDVVTDNSSVIVPSYQIAFNPNTSVNSTADFIYSSSHSFYEGEKVFYYRDTGNTASMGLTNATAYFIRFPNTLGFAVSTTVSGSNVNLTASSTVESGHYIKNFISDFILIPSNTVSFNATDDVDSTNEFINIAGSPFVDGDLVRYYTSGGNTALTGLSNSVLYTVTGSNSSGIKLTSSLSSILTPINITGSNVVTFNSGSSVDGATDFISIASANTFLANGDLVRYYVGPSSSALTGLTANSLYYVRYATSSGLALSLTPTGANVDISPLSPGDSFHYLRYYSAVQTGHNIKNYSNPYVDKTHLLYNTPYGNTVIGGLSNTVGPATSYYVVNSSSIGIQLSSSISGANIALTANTTGGENHYLSTVSGYLPNDKVYQNIVKIFNANTAVNGTNETIAFATQPFANGDFVTYYTNTGNTVLTGLANNGTYYIVGASASSVKLSLTLNGTPINLTAASSVLETGHNLSATPVADVQSVFIDQTTGANYVRIQNKTNTFANTFALYSYTNPYVSAVVSNVALYQITSTAKGIVKAGSNTSVLKVKRLTFENTFVAGSPITGDVSGSSATIYSVVEDPDLLYPIGLNADIQANVVTANGQISSLQIVDSGFGYVNSEIITFSSTDGSRSGSAKMIIDGSGKGKGYYKSSKGFLSDDMYIHDGDYYQEYSYEILSKMSFEKYSDMFKKVMHVAGTKFFGSALVVEEASVALALSEIATGAEIAFNAADDVDAANERINLNIEKNTRGFNALGDVDQVSDFITLSKTPEQAPQPFANGDYVKYYSYGPPSIIFTGGGGAGANYTATVVDGIVTGFSMVSQGSGYTTAPDVSFQSIHGAGATATAVLTADKVTSLTLGVGGSNYNSGAKIKIGDGSSTLSNNGFYYVVASNASGIKIAVSKNGTAIDLNTSSIPVELHYFRNYINPFSNGDIVMYNVAAGNTAVSPLANGVNYYIMNTTPMSVQLSTSSVLSAINITASGTSEVGHYLTKTVEEIY
jgi:hypothetical protein